MKRGAPLDRRMERMGTDLKLAFSGPAGLWEDADLDLERGRPRRGTDAAVAQGIDAIDQMLINRLKTQQGELAALGHPLYGSRHHELIGEPNVERTRNLIKLHILEALSHEPRLEQVLSCEVSVDPADPSAVRIAITAKIIAIDEPRNLVVGFGLE
ncbi:MAG: GPW/gp25 family protein [Desulfobulbus sp.]|jgi:phage baseplate assembly protein W